MSIYKSNRKQSKIVISDHRSVKKVFNGNNLLFCKESFENIFTASGSNGTNGCIYIRYEF